MIHVVVEWPLSICSIDFFYHKDDEFENEPVAPKKANVVEDFDDDVEDAIVEDVDSEFNHLLDEEEFEG